MCAVPKTHTTGETIASTPVHRILGRGPRCRWAREAGVLLPWPLYLLQPLQSLSYRDISSADTKVHISSHTLQVGVSELRLGATSQFWVGRAGLVTEGTMKC